jgi:TolB protein
VSLFRHRSSLTLWTALLTLVTLAGVTSSARAAWPGSNGRIAYTEFLGEESHIRSVLLSGKGDREVSGDGFHPEFSPDGRRLAFCPWFSGGLIQASSAGRVQKRIRAPAPGSPGEGLSWSPDGRRLVVAWYFLDDNDACCRPELYLHRRTRASRLTGGDAPVWSVRGDIAFLRPEGIYAVRPDGSRLRRLWPAYPRSVHPKVDWSPDGRRLIFATAGGDIATISADGRDFRRLTVGRPVDGSPAFSPDGKYFAFIRESSGTVMVRRLRGGRPRRITLSTDETVCCVDWQPAAPIGRG